AEVEDLQASARRHPEVGGLQVAVDDAFGVGRLEAVGELDAEADDLIDRQRAESELGLEPLAGDQLQHQEIDPRVAAELVDRADIRMVQAGDGERFAVEAAAGAVVSEHAGRQHLQRDVAIEMLVVGAVDDTHPAGADLFEHAEMRQRLRDQRHLGCTRPDRSFIRGDSLSAEAASAEPVWCSIAGPRRRTDHGRGWTSQRLAGSGRSWNRRVRGDRRSLLYSPFEKLALRSRRAPRFHRPTNMRRLSYNRSVKRPQRSFVPRQTEAPYRIWGTGLEPDAVQQLKNACQLPVAVSGALMPDAHVGYGLPIGGVLATRDAVIPYAVGVDIACRMKMSVLDLPLTALVDEQDRLKQALQRETQFGIGASFKTRRQHEVMDADWHATRVTAGLKDRAWAQLGTSGSGNHFVEFGQLTVLNPAAGLP